MDLNWLSPGDNAWQMTAATFVGLMSVPGLVVLYGGVMQKRWSVNSMMMAFIAFALVLIVWVLFGFKMAFGAPMHIFGADHGFFGNMWGKPGAILNSDDLLKQGNYSARRRRGSSRSRHWLISSSCSRRSPRS